MSLNSCVFQGRMTKDPELRTTQTGKSATSFTLAVDRDYDRETCDFINCVIWGKGAEFTEKYFSKGQQALVRGSLQMREWKDKDGNKRISAEINVAEIHFCGPKQKQEFTEVEGEDLDGELPF